MFRVESNTRLAVVRAQVAGAQRRTIENAFQPAHVRVVNTGGYQRATAAHTSSLFSYRGRKVRLILSTVLSHASFSPCG